MQDSVVSDAYDFSKVEKFRYAFNRIIKFLGDLFFIIFVAIILVAIVYGIYTKKNGDKGYVPIVSAYVIVSNSMVPTINVTDAVIAYRPNINSLKRGDIITFSSTDARYSGLTVTHRILSVSETEDGQVAFKTKGDNNTTPDDALVLGSNVYGKVFFVIPWLGYLQMLLTKAYGWIIFIVLPCIAIILYDIIKLGKTLKCNKSTSDIKFKDVEIHDDKSEVVTKLDVLNESSVLYDLSTEKLSNRYHVIVVDKLTRVKSNNLVHDSLVMNTFDDNMDEMLIDTLEEEHYINSVDKHILDDDMIDVDILESDIIDHNLEDKKIKEETDSSEIELL